ncbi:MAG: cysteine synthase A [Spirochaetales bacterium]|nr:cysteine synthase A [Spirochaetales bacterium]
MRADNVSELIGKTPLVRINRLCGKNAEVFAKLEYFNPGSSVKDRIALALIEDGENRGLIRPGTVIVEPTSGNTGIGLAMVCAVRGYPLILTMPDTLSIERRQILAGFGAKLVLTPGSLGMRGAVEKAEEIAAELSDSWIPGQFTNPANPDCHFATTAREIWQDSNGLIDILITGVGTGGTISGTAKGLRELNPDLKVIAVEPASSPVITQTMNKEELKPRSHKIQGIGAGFIPENLDLSVIDEVMAIKDEDAADFSRRLMKEEGIFAGISAGAAACASFRAAQRSENKGRVIVFIVPDTGERYLSQGMFN